MSVSSTALSACRQAVCAAMAVAILLAASVAASAQQVVASQNVNMVGGPWSFDRNTGRIVGDPFLQRQNEPSMAVSSRNPCHFLAGANDYRAVDVPGFLDDQETGDAWLGVFTSIDCGRSWQSTLLPGYPQDLSDDGFASPLKGLAAAADATVRPGPGGMIYYSGLAFNRGENNVGKVFVSRFVDHNNQEQGTPIRYAGTVAVDTGTSGQFLDKPWIATDIPRDGRTCTVDGDTMPAGPVYLVYTSFVGSGNNLRSKIMFSVSTDCGATWSNPAKLSERYARNQGTVLAVSPDGAINVAWREFADAGDPASVHRILFSRSTDGGKSFSKAVAIEAGLSPFDQGSSSATRGLSFRTNAYPTVAVDGSGRIYVAWAARGYAADGDALRGDARIVMVTSSDGSAWSLPRSVVDNYPGRGHQIMPALAFAAGKLALVYYDFRFDLRGFNSYVAGDGHTVDLRAAMANPGASPTFTDYVSVNDEGEPVRASSQVSRYLQGYYARNGQRQEGPNGTFVQLQYNPPNLPMFALGTTPFIGDYIDVASQQFVLDANRQWRFNTQRNASGLPVPVFHATWTDNRDVRRPPAGENWTTYKAPTIIAGERNAVIVCDPGTNPGSRNQNVYTSALTPGLVVSVPGNQKAVNRSLGIQRAFVVFVRNASGRDRQYRLTLSQPQAPAYASFLPIDEQAIAGGGLVPVTPAIGPVDIPARSSIARTVFMVAPPGAPHPTVTANVTDVDGIESAAVVLNPDIANPDIANPDIANPDIANPDIANPDIANAEVYNPDIANPDIANPDIANPDIANPDIANPDIANPDIANTDVANPDIANLSVLNPDIANPDIANPDIANPDIANPDIANPDIANPDIANAATGDYTVTDVSWPVKNTGNTTAAYAFKAKLTSALPRGTHVQLIAHNSYIAPFADPQNGCMPAVQNQVLVNIPRPDLNTNLFTAFDPNEYRNNASFYLLPGEQAKVTLRVYCPKGDPGCPTAESARTLAAARVEAQAPNNCPEGAEATYPNCRVNALRPDDIYDVSPPVTTCRVTSEGVGYDCADGLAFRSGASVSLTAADGVGVESTTCTINGQPCSTFGYRVSDEGYYTVSYSSRDYSGNEEEPRSFAIEIDGSAPTLSGISFPGVTDPDAWVKGTSVTGVIDAADSSRGSLTVSCTDTNATGSVSVSQFSLTVSGEGTHRVTCTVTDAAGNRSTAEARVNLDGSVPTFETVAPVVTAEAAGPGGAAVGYDITATDSWSGATVSCSPASGSTFTLGDAAVTCDATDGAGNTATTGFTVRVVDTTAPLFTEPTGLVAEASGPAGGAVPFVVTATDAVDPAPAVQCTPSAGSVFPVGTTAVTCLARDASGNTASRPFIVTVTDTVAPVFTLPAGIVAEATSAAGAVVAFAPAAVDAVGGAVRVTCAPASGSVFGLGTTAVTCAASDAAGNTAAGSFPVTVADTTPPALVLPSGISGIEATGPAGAAVAYVASASDAVDGTVSATCAPASGAVFPITTTTVTCTAEDRARNMATGSFTVTVVDSTPPSVTVSISPTSIWSPNGAMVAITVSGTANDSGSGIARVRFSVIDEYGALQPSGDVTLGPEGTYSFGLQLQASRKGSDKNGRLYTVTVTATNGSGGSTSRSTQVVAVEHDQSK